MVAAESSFSGYIMKNYVTSLFCVSLTVFTLQSALAEDRRLVIASWNVENLFDTVDDPDNENDDGYTPRGWAQWTDKKYQVKLEHLAEVIFYIKPDILCLAEVENRQVLEDLSKTLEEKFSYDLPVIIHRDGGDFRGIDVAMMAKLKPSGKKWFNTVFGQRDVLACEFVIDGRKLIVLANHWKSKLGDKKKSDYTRNQQALSVRKFIDRELNSNPAAAIVVAGDFNSDINTSFLTESAGFMTELDALKEPQNSKKLYNLAAGLGEKERKTYYYVRGNKWNSFDSISVTRGMVGLKPLSPWKVKTNSYTVYKSEKVCFPGVGSPLPYRRVRSKKYGDRFVDGYSDHFAVYFVLEMALKGCDSY